MSTSQTDEKIRHKIFYQKAYKKMKLFWVVKKRNAAYKILHFPKQILNNSQFDWSKAEVPLI